MVPSRPLRGHDSHENVFARHYDVLMRQALRWTNRDRAQAEDLLHDVYLQFVGLKAEMEEPEKTLGYLCRMLRNLSISRVRRANSLPMSDLSLVDYDTAESSLAQADRRALIQARYVLQRTCIYACERKSTAVSASVLILRFFHGYFPSETAAVCKRSRSSIDNFLTLARREAKLAVERPGVLQVLDRPAAQSFEVDHTISEDMLHDLCEVIFQHVQGRCLTVAELERRYSPADSNALTASELSHLVSCRTCLDRVNDRLGFPKLSDRYPPETTGRDSRSRKGPISVKKAEAVRFLDKARRRSQSVREHHPRELQIAVNGRIKASHSVTSAISTLDLRVGVGKVASFVEVLSEQSICLLYLSVMPNSETGGCDHHAGIDLSDDRRLLVTVSPELQGLRISVVYSDPSLEAALEPALSPHQQPALSYSVETLRAEEEKAQETLPLSGLLPWLGRLPKFFQRRFQKALANLSRPGRISMSPTLATAMILAVASIACFVLWVREPLQINADTLLAKAEVWDVRQGANVKPGVIYQKLHVTTPSQSFDMPVYRDARGVRKRRQQKAGSRDKFYDQLRLAGVDPGAPLSAGSYQEWHDSQRMRVDSVTRAGQSLLKLTTSATIGPVSEASLTVRASDFHPVERTIELRGQPGRIEIAELSYEVLPWNSQTEELFDPENLRAGEDILRPSHAIRMPHLAAQLSDGQLDEAELSARLALNRLHADNGERINLVRTATGIQISGIVETDDRKRELESQLRELSNVHPSLLTYREMEQRLAPTTDGSVKFASVSSQPTPLQTYLEDQRWSQERIGEFSFGLSRNAELIDRECKAIDELIGQFASGKVLSIKADAALSELLSQHRNSLLDLVRQEQDALSAARDHPDRDSAPTASAANLRALANRNVDLARELTSTSSESVPSDSTSAKTASSDRAVSDTLTDLAAIVNSLQSAAFRLNVPQIAKGPVASATNTTKSNRNE